MSQGSILAVVFAGDLHIGVGADDQALFKLDNAGGGVDDASQTQSVIVAFKQI